MKLDMSKAYDKVEWIFIEKVMLQMGFELLWVSLIMDCISPVSFSVMFNSDLQGYFKPARGLRQGDPLSPYLFLICAESLSRMLSFELQSGGISGCKITRSCPTISHLLFDDDSLLFCKASIQECQTIHKILSIYEKASDQCVNFDKSAMLFSPNVGSSERQGRFIS